MSKRSLKDPYSAHMYAKDVAESTRDDTREIDMGPRKDTREAALKDPYWTERYQQTF